MNASPPAPSAPLPTLVDTARSAEPRRELRAAGDRAPAPTGRWWFAFDRWHVVAADPQSEFVLA